MRKFLFLFFTFIIFIFGIIHYCSAQEVIPKQFSTSSPNAWGNQPDIIQTPSHHSDTDPLTFIINTINIILGLVGIISITLIPFGAIKWFVFRKDAAKGKSGKRIFIFGIVSLFLTLFTFAIASYFFDPIFEKPVIYLYPEKKQDITVQLDYQGEIIADYPKYNYTIKGWHVTAFPDGKIVNHEDSKEYSYLFWEGKSSKKIDWNLTNGFVVKGEDTKEFLQSSLAKAGLTPKEYNEFIVYWYPLMKDNKYNLIHFAGKEYADTAPLHITPEPDSVLRVFMVYKPLSKHIDVKPQVIEPFERKGFAVVEWGGTEVK